MSANCAKVVCAVVSLACVSARRLSQSCVGSRGSHRFETRDALEFELLDLRLDLHRFDLADLRLELTERRDSRVGHAHKGLSACEHRAPDSICCAASRDDEPVLRLHSRQRAGGLRDLHTELRY